MQKEKMTTKRSPHGITIRLSLAALAAGLSLTLSAAAKEGRTLTGGGGASLSVSARTTPHGIADSVPHPLGAQESMQRMGQEGSAPREQSERLWILGQHPDAGGTSPEASNTRTAAGRTRTAAAHGETAAAPHGAANADSTTTITPGTTITPVGLVTRDSSSTITPGRCATPAGSAVRPFVRPPFLQEGDSVGVVSISSRIDEEQLKHALQSLDILRSWGLRLRLAPHLFDRNGGWFAAPDSVRARDLQQMIDNPHLRAIIFFRGGYGAVRILDRVKLDRLRRDPKWLVGFSDLTTIHAALQHVGVESIHGAMPGGFRTLHPERDTSALWLREALFGRVAGYHVAPHPLNHPGRAHGRLAGGNLSVMHALNGTPEAYDLEHEPVILLIEDVGESIHHIDRMMQTLRRSGRLDRIAGLVVGDFTHIRNEKRWEASVYEVIDSYARELHVPVLYGLPAGHDRLNVALYMGRDVELVVTDGGGSLRFL